MIIKKIYRRAVRELNRKRVLLKETRALRPLIAMLDVENFQNMESLSKSTTFRNVLQNADIDVAALNDLIELLRKETSGRKILLRPHNFAGHLTHYHHFFGAVILPLLEWASAGVVSKGDKLVIRDCGPMNTELLQWADLLGLQAVPVPHCLIPPLAISGIMEVWDAPGYDFSFREDWYPRTMIVDKIRNHVFQLMDNISSGQEVERSSYPKIVIIARAKPDPFYKSRKADTKTSGAERRSIPNLDELVESISDLSKNVEVAYLENMKVADKIRLFRDVDLVVGQMGAGLNNAIWMKPGSAMIEILSLDGIRHNFAVFANICYRTNIRHRRVFQESNHAYVNIPIIMGFVKDFIMSEKR
jgi:hypothetical protein